MECAIESYIKDLERPKTPEAVDNTEILKLQLQLQKNKQSLDEYVSKNCVIISVSIYAHSY